MYLNTLLHTSGAEAASHADIQKSWHKKILPQGAHSLSAYWPILAIQDKQINCFMDGRNPSDMHLNEVESFSAIPTRQFTFYSGYEWKVEKGAGHKQEDETKH